MPDGRERRSVRAEPVRRRHAVCGSIGRTDLPGGDTEVLLRSITEVLFAYPDDTPVYSGHGAPTTIGGEADESVSDGGVDQGRAGLKSPARRRSATSVPAVSAAPTGLQSGRSWKSTLRSGLRRFHHHQLHRPDPQLVAFLEDGAVDALAVDVGAVGAFEIDRLDFAGAGRQAAVQPRDERGVDNEVSAGRGRWS